MPSYVLVPPQRPGKSGELDGSICPPDGIIGPDRKAAVAVRVRIIDEQTINIDGKTHQILHGTGVDDGSAVYLIDAASVHNRERRAALAQAYGQLHQLRDSLLPLKGESERPELATEGLALLEQWIADERERLTRGNGLYLNLLNQ